MDLRLLRAFVTVARLRNFGAAAEELSTSQPALTKQIQVLERRVGSVLFSRGRHGARLTQAGQLLLADALELLERSEAFDRRAAQVARGAKGRSRSGSGCPGSSSHHGRSLCSVVAGPVSRCHSRTCLRRSSANVCSRAVCRSGSSGCLFLPALNTYGYGAIGWPSQSPRLSKFRETSGSGSTAGRSSGSPRHEGPA